MSLDWLAHVLEERERQSLLRQTQAVQYGPSATVKLDQRWLINFGSNDYLGLSSHPSVIAAGKSLSADQPTIDRFGSGASPLVTGYSELHAALEEAIAKFEGVASAIIFTSGYAANTGTIAALANDQDLILSDTLNHASLIDGCRLSGARILVYRHNDPNHVEELLQKHRSDFRRALIVTDSVFSMDGDVAELKSLTETCNRYDADIVIDEAHGTGVFGAHGRGLAEALNMEDKVAVRIGTLSKAVGCAGGFVSGNPELVSFLKNFARSYVYSTSLPLPVVKAAAQAIKLIPGMTDERDQLRERAQRIRSAVQSLGLATIEGCSPIIPVIVGDSMSCCAMQTALRDRGFYVPAIRPPTVPVGSARLRISLSAAHTDEQLDALIAAMKLL